MCHWCWTGDGVALHRRTRILFCCTTTDKDISVAALRWIPGCRYGDPTVVRRNLPCGKEARPCHCYPKALPANKPFICKQTRQWQGILSADPGAQCVCGLLDAFLPLGAAGRRVQPSFVHLRHPGASRR